MANRWLNRVNVRDDETVEDQDKQQTIDYIYSADANFYIDPTNESNIKKASPFEKYFENMIQKQFFPSLNKNKLASSDGIQVDNKIKCEIFYRSMR